MPTTPDTAVLEVRNLPVAAAAPVLTRADDDSAPRFAGHAAVFNSRTAIGNPLTWGFYETIAPGAFDDTLADERVCMLVDHDTSLLVSRVAAGDLTLSTDDVGLAVDSELDVEVSYVRDLHRNLERGRVRGMSFGFRVLQDDWQLEEVSTSDGQTAQVEVRTIEKVQLFEVSAVTFPAYEDTDAGLRSQISEVRKAAGRPAAAPAHDSPAAGGDTERPTRDARPADDAAARLAAHRARQVDDLARRYRLERNPA